MQDWLYNFRTTTLVYWFTGNMLTITAMSVYVHRYVL